MTGEQGDTTSGLAGATGRSGPRGPHGPKGEVGAQGRVGAVGQWTSYRDFWFESDSADIQDSERSKLVEIAAYLKKNPTLQIGIDGATDQTDNDSRGDNLSGRRVDSIRNALVEAGVPSSKITSGAFGQKELRRDRRVEVLIATAN